MRCGDGAVKVDRVLNATEGCRLWRLASIAIHWTATAKVSEPPTVGRTSVPASGPAETYRPPDAGPRGNEEGLVAVNNMFCGADAHSYEAIPSVIYTHRKWHASAAPEEELKTQVQRIPQGGCTDGYRGACSWWSTKVPAGAVKVLTGARYGESSASTLSARPRASS